MNEKTDRRTFLKSLLASGIVLTGAGGLGSFAGGCERRRDVRFEKVYDFIEHLDEAEVITSNDTFVRKLALAVKGAPREVLLEHPPSEITYKHIQVGNNPSLQFGIGIGDGARERGCDGVFFEVILTDHEGPHSVYARMLEVNPDGDDRRWIDEVIDLAAFAGKEVSFTFRTGPGPRGDNSADWSGWSEPRLYSSVTKRVGSSRHANVVLITLDTTRADHVSCYGYQRKTTPTLDKLAQKSLVFDNAISPSPWTIPAHASLFTGLYPVQHGAVTRIEGDVVSGYPLPEYNGILARLVRSHGYRTAGFVGGPFLKSEFGFAQGFDTYDDTWQGYDRRADRINTKAVRWLDENYEAPFFLFINYFDPHAPYNPPQAFGSTYGESYEGTIDFATFGPHKIMLGKEKPLKGRDLSRAVDLYDAEILFMDSCLGRLLQRLEELGVLDDSLLIIIADHGESFGEQDLWGHGNLPVESQVRVPLVIHCPSVIKRAVHVPFQVQTSSVFATILRFLHIGVPPAMKAPWYDVDLLALKNRRNAAVPEYTFAERYLGDRFLGMLRTDTWKYLVDETAAKSGKETKEWLFDRENDPQELRNLLEIETTRAKEAKRRFAQVREMLGRTTIQKNGFAAGRQGEMDEEMRERLKALGYVH